MNLPFIVHDASIYYYWPITVHLYISYPSLLSYHPSGAYLYGLCHARPILYISTYFDRVIIFVVRFIYISLQEQFSTYSADYIVSLQYSPIYSSTTLLSCVPLREYVSLEYYRRCTHYHAHPFSVYAQVYHSCHIAYNFRQQMHCLLRLRMHLLSHSSIVYIFLFFFYYIFLLFQLECFILALYILLLRWWPRSFY